MLHNTTTTTFFDGQSARPQQVRVLLFNEQLHLYEADEDLLLQSFPLKTCYLQENSGSPIVYVNPEHTSRLVLDHSNAITGMIIEVLGRRQQSWYSRFIKTRLLLLLAILAILVAGIYFFFAEAIPRVALHFISVQQEEKLGQVFFESVVQKNALDTSASRVTQAFADKLQLSKVYPIKVYVIRNKEINAFALPGGIITIHSGILNKMNSYEELVALLGHEVTHINDRHSLRSMLRQLSFSAFISIVTGDMQGISSAIISNAAALQTLSYSRKLEASADQKGMQILLDNRVNPEGMVQLMQRMEVAGGDMPVGFLSSHPLTKQRIAAARAFIKTHEGLRYPPRTDLEDLWKQLRNLSSGTGTGF